MATFNQLIQSHPTEPRAYYNRALARMGETKLCYMTADPGNDPSLAWAREEACKAKAIYWQSAIVDCTEAIRQDPWFADVYLARGFAYQQIGDENKAADDFATARGLNRCTASVAR